MKNLSLLLLTGAILAACAAPGDTPGTAEAMISFEEISKEITVSHETLAGDGLEDDVPETTVAVAR